MRGQLVRKAALGIGVWFLVVGDLRGDETPPIADWPAPIAQDLQRIQKALGGSVVEEFPSLRAKPQAAGAASGSLQRRAVAALREAAAQLDVTANRLEGLELYRQADGLREQAQRLRLDARGMIEGPRSMPMPSRTPQPAVHPDSDERERRVVEPGQEIQPGLDDSDLQPVPMPDR
jgi:hypothetical protein